MTVQPVPTPMHSRRLLVADASGGAGLAPIYLAIATLLCLSVFGFVVAAWPAQPPGEGDNASRSFHQGLHAAPDAGESRSRMRWM